MKVQLYERAVQTVAIAEAVGHAAETGKGRAFFVPGSPGVGKTAFLRETEERVRDRFPDIVTVRIGCSSPVARVSVGEVQPLLPFREAIELIGKKRTGTARKRFALNVGMTVLASIPVFGDLFYAVKEIKRDVSEYRKDVGNDGRDTNVVEEFFTALQKLSEESPLCIMIDDLQWSDSQSLRLIKRLIQGIHAMNLVLVLAFRPTANRTGISAIHASHTSIRSCTELELPTLGEDAVRVWTKTKFPDKDFSTLGKWIYSHTDGVPALVQEYLVYFTRTQPFDASGRVLEEALTNETVPSSLDALLNETLDQLTNEDRHILSLASAEGIECTVHLMSRLLNQDVLATVRTLKDIQRRTGILRSKGAQKKYNVTTTVYEFSQRAWQRLFYEFLEYEEKQAVHARISTVLSDEFAAASSDAEKAVLAPFIAAHANETNEQSMLSSVLSVLAQEAEHMQDAEGVQAMMSAFENFADIAQSNQELSSIVQGLEGVNTDTVAQSLVEGIEDLPLTALQFASVKRAMIDLMAQQDFERGLQVGESFMHKVADDLTPEQSLALLALKARLKFLNGNVQESLRVMDAAQAYLGEEPHSSESTLWHVLLLNSKAEALRSTEPSTAEALMEQASKLSLSLPQWLQILCTANIGTTVYAQTPELQVHHHQAAAKAAREYGFARVVATLDTTEL